MRMTSRRQRLALAGGVALGLLCLGLAIAWILEREQSDPENGAFVPSLAGTEPDGQFRASKGLQPYALGPAGHGQVTSADLPNEALKRMFDYYLTALGEADEANVLAHIRREIDKNLSGPHAKAAHQLLTKYVDYKKALAELEQSLNRHGGAALGGVEGIRQRFEGMQQLRQKFFDAREQEDMFGFEEAYDQLALAQLDITQNQTLSERQKTERLNALHANLPSQLKAELEAPRQVVQLQDKAEKMREQGASDDEIYRLRASAVSPAAADRLAAVDREEIAWKNRIAQYQAARQQILQSTQSAPEQRAALQQLQAREFSAHERPRLAAYE